jgi:hypothetical protein
MGDKKSNQKRRKDNKTLSKKNEKGREEKLDKKAIKNKESKIKHMNCQLLLSSI